MLNIRKSDIVTSLVLLLVLAVMFIPIPTALLDMLLVINVAIGILMMVYIISIKDPLEFSSFPSVLLMVTLMRLSVNVSSTRSILLNAFAGNVIESFGSFVAGGNYLVGLVIFTIIVVINFKVITKGSGRVAEVAARFTLDALPGKQMSIDADLNQGIIDEKEAVLRREKLVQETDFYGAMDGASKFVSGDAIAGLIIIVINILAGFAIGMTQKGMSAGEALSRYTILTIGDGLVSQIPALVISTAAGVLVTRATSDGDLGSNVKAQLFCRPRPLMLTGSMLIAAGLVPGLPFLPFFTIGGVFAGMGYAIGVRQKRAEAEAAQPAKSSGGKLDAGSAGKKAAPAQIGEPTAKAYKEVLQVAALELRIGFGLVGLVDRQQGGNLIDRIGNVRNQVAEEMGIVIPPVNVQDDMSLSSGDYRVYVRGLEIARYNISPNCLLAIDPGGGRELEGFRETKDPSFGFRAWWVPENRRSAVEARGFTLVDAASVITTHLATLVRSHAAQLLSRQNVSELIEQVKDQNKAVVEELIPNKLEIGPVHRVLQELLKEQVSIRDLPVILETLSDSAGQTKDVGLLTELCRSSLGGTITQPYLSPEGTLKAIGLHPDLERLLKESGSSIGATTSLRMDPETARSVLDYLAEAVGKARRAGIEPVLIASPAVRRMARQLAQCEIKELPVLSLGEVPEWVNVDIINMLPIPRPREPEMASA
ncbi:MAG: flagellar biosynthesis protein FlhA [Pontiellaceae bacterium]|nr:flagellar biosynthesis protein FlhA [Pontiellaceae bacterium]MBN2784103.1 flagellar biosynthesis protein FlhA [Pontiellaceae bacterium]